MITAEEFFKKAGNALLDVILDIQELDPPHPDLALLPGLFKAVDILVLSYQSVLKGMGYHVDTKSVYEMLGVEGEDDDR